MQVFKATTLALATRMAEDPAIGTHRPSPHRPRPRPRRRTTTSRAPPSIDDRDDRVRHDGVRSRTPRRSVPSASDRRQAVELDHDKQAALDATLEAYTEELRAAGDDESGRHPGLHAQPAPRCGAPPCACCRCRQDRRCSTWAAASASSPSNWPPTSGWTCRGWTSIRASSSTRSSSARSARRASSCSPRGRRSNSTKATSAPLRFDDDRFDLAFVRELLQFLTDPVQAVGELHRVVRPGGYACVSDTDDQLHITWPEHSPALARLVGAVSDIQHARGGDRQCGRKLSTYLRQVGVRHRLGGGPARGPAPDRQPRPTANVRWCSSNSDSARDRIVRDRRP